VATADGKSSKAQGVAGGPSFSAPNGKQLVRSDTHCLLGWLPALLGNGVRCARTLSRLLLKDKLLLPLLGQMALDLPPAKRAAYSHDWALSGGTTYISALSVGGGVLRPVSLSGEAMRIFF
jgi:hypothetical protein